MLVSTHAPFLLSCIIASACAFAPAHDVSFLNGRQAANASASPVVDLGYARYQGYRDSDFGFDVYKGSAPWSNLGVAANRLMLLVGSVTLLRRLVNFVGKHLNVLHLQIIGVSSRPPRNRHCVRNQALRKRQQYMVSSPDQGMRTACFSMFMRHRTQEIFRSLYGYVC